jgi:pimeloyl-ACP methyl ester carboxylesterase
VDAETCEASLVDREGRLERAEAAFFTTSRSARTARDEALLLRGVTLKGESELAVTSWGEGPAVLLVHGWNSRGTHWGAHIDALNEAGFRAVAVDAPGHGESPGERCHVVQFGRVLVEVGRQIGPLAGVVAHSFGAGAVVLALDRGLVADRVALLSGPASLVAVVERWGRAHELSESEIPAFVERVARAVNEPIADLDLTRIASTLRLPALIVHDRDDDEVPVGDARVVAAAWPGARLLVTERFGHRRILIAREVVRAVVAFLNKQEA